MNSLDNVLAVAMEACTSLTEGVSACVVCTCVYSHICSLLCCRGGEERVTIGFWIFSPSKLST